MDAQPVSPDVVRDPPPIPLRVVPDAADAGRSVLESGNTNPLILRGQGPTAGPLTFACGGCGAVLLEGVRGDEFPNTLLACAACGACNEGPAAPREAMRRRG